MKARCLNQNHVAYSRYGGRGIIVCNRWLEYNNFLEDMGERPLGKTIDRIDRDKGYCKENCRWATEKEQSENRYKNWVYVPKRQKISRPNILELDIPIGLTEKEEMMYLKKLNCTYKSIGEYYGLTRQRIHQILKYGY